jgi:hypothetical protein
MRNLSTVLAIPCLITLFLSGCATGEKFSKETPSAVSEALIYVYRPQGFIGIAQRPDLKIDGKFVGSVASGGFLVQRVPLGVHELVLTGEGNAFKWNYPTRVIAVATMASKNYYYRYKPRSATTYSNTIVHFYAFELIPESDALKELADLKRAE